MKMKVYILFTDTNTVFSRIIKLYTKKKYNHVSISFNKKLAPSYSFGRKKITNPFKGGFVQEQLDCDLFGNADCVIYSCDVTTEEYERMLEQVQQIENQKTFYRYNLLGVLGVVLQREFNRKRAFFCSQFVATILLEGGITFDNKPLGLITPYDIQKSKKLKFEYRGCVKSYSSLLESCNKSGLKSEMLIYQ